MANNLTNKNVRTVPKTILVQFCLVVDNAVDNAVYVVDTIAYYDMSVWVVFVHNGFVDVANRTDNYFAQFAT